MKPLENNVLIYDDGCPLCRVYTKGFIDYGMLGTNGRMCYSDMDNDMVGLIDKERARNEIALVDVRSKTVLYGVDSLVKVICHSYPWASTILNHFIINAFLKKAYSFVSFNRRIVVVGFGKHCNSVCIPDFHFGYRIAYILFCFLLTATILTMYTPKIQTIWPMKSGYFGESLLLAGQMFLQFAIVGWYAVPKRLIVDYLGNLMTVSIAGSLLLSLPLLATVVAGDLPAAVFECWFFGVAIAMFLEHGRRVQLLGLPATLSISWLLYRIAILMVAILS